MLSSKRYSKLARIIDLQQLPIDIYQQQTTFALTTNWSQILINLAYTTKHQN